MNMGDCKPKKSLSDDQLLLQIAGGDVGAFEELLVKYESSVYHFVLKLVQSKEVAEEITQDVFLKLWETLSHGNTIAHASAWLFMSSRNLGLNKLKEEAARKRREEAYAVTASGEEDPYFDLQLRDLEYMVEKAIDRMPARPRTIFQMKTVEGLTNEQIADRLDISPHTVKNNLTKSYAILREFIREHAISLILAMLYGGNTIS